MPIPSTNISTPNERILVDDLPYVDQEYGDPTLREAVNKNYALQISKYLNGLKLRLKVPCVTQVIPNISASLYEALVLYVVQNSWSCPIAF